MSPSEGQTRATGGHVSGGHIKLVGLTKRFGHFVAVDGIDLDIRAGEFFSLLGPSGCGKTTTLRIIAGFEEPSSGSVLLDGVDMVRTSPARRPVNTVFQSYALFPHLRIKDNVAFGLRRQRVRGEELRRRVADALELVQLSTLADRKPAQLSGGQQQRVALARALVLQPSVLLLDEPLGALDAKLRRQLQVELKQLQERVGITFVYVTHDQEEALTMSDRLAVMNHGRVEQVGPPREVYEEPRTSYVADFLGVSNLMPADAVGPSGTGVRLRLADGVSVQADAGDFMHRGPATVTIRPERVVLEPQESGGPNRVAGMVTRSVFLGSALQAFVHLTTGTTITVLTSGRDGRPPDELRPGTPVSVFLPPAALRVLAGTAGPSERLTDPAEPTGDS